MEASRLEITEAADLLGITVRSVQRLISLEKLPAEKVPRGASGWKYLVPLSALPPEVQDSYLKCKTEQHHSPNRSAADKRHLPARTEKSALARADLLAAWRKDKALHDVEWGRR
ncbi:MAG: helix-turn-helix domain-containing protein [Nitrospirota bacterium]